MAGTERNEYRPRRARPADDVPPELPDQDSADQPEDGTTASPRGRRGTEPAAAPIADPQPAAQAAASPETKQPDEQPDEQPVDRPTRWKRPRRREAAADPAPESVQETATAPAIGGSTGKRPRSTDETVAESQRAERLAELRRLRDTSPGPHDLPPRSDRPDVGRRQNVAEPDIAGGSSNRHGLVLATVAVVVVAAIVVGYLIVHGRTGATVAQSSPAATTAPLSTSMVSSRTMVSPEIAGSVADSGWQITADQPATGGNAPVPACLAARPADAPTPSQAMVRTLTSGGNGRSIVHLAQAYRTPELATEAFALVAKSLGECDLAGSYIQDARVITGLGDQATGVVLEDPVKHSFRSVVADRTGRMVNVVDAGQTGSAPDIDKVATALAEVTDVQCPIAVGICASDPKTADGPPPIGGDQPGFLAVADLPRPRTGKGTWGGLDPGSPADVVTSGCEDVSFDKLTADNRTARSYILTDAPKGMPKTFGLDEVVLTMKSDADAGKQAKTIASNLRSCEDRLPTATVGKVAAIRGTGADGTAVTGSVTTVDQKVTDKKTSHYRVGIVAAGDKLVYTFLPTTDDWDLTTGQWTTVTIRAAQRATQVR